MATSDIDPCRGTLTLENAKFAYNANGDVVIRVGDDESLAALNQILTQLGGSVTTTADHFNGTVGTSSVQVPSSAGNPISEVLIHNTSSGNKDLLVSFDGGTLFKTLPPDASLIWNLKSDLTQIDIKGSVASTDYEIIMNREP